MVFVLDKLRQVNFHLIFSTGKTEVLRVYFSLHDYFNTKYYFNTVFLF